MKKANYEIFSIMSRIEGMSNQFTKTDWKIVQYIKSNTKDFILYSAQDLAYQIGISDASVIRFAQKIGFSGLNELKYTLQNELEKEYTPSKQDYYATLQHDYHLLTETLFEFTSSDNIDILRKQMLSADRIFIVGLELNRNIAEMIAHKFTLLGLNIRSITTYDTLKLFANLSSPKDVFLIITLSGNHKILANHISKLVENDSYIALVSNYEKSLCSAYADLTFLIPKIDLLECNDIISRELFIIMLFDIIFQSFLKENKESYQVFQKTAPFSNQNSMET